MSGSLSSHTRVADPRPAGLAAIPTQSGSHTHCRTCLAPAPESLYRVVGVWSVINSIALWDCESCARERILEIEDGQDVRGSRR
ncbi:hypothetical protein KIH74_03710 [Kineosporia sp. J2-2]|uniref:Uncharacterized protein n=1 Tax=Kineosporia corallincola TaxID=2835133 RepID=A0ABS5TAC2_9ACTN|nr:hypothetical protein [Kineosporia corallincola]MBT0768015.1 hypothetical protein [Kineosporia corallincola]